MNKQAAIKEYQEFYSDECASLLSRHLRRAMNQRGGDIWGSKAQWTKYLTMRAESIAYLKANGLWLNTGPTDGKRILPDDEAT